MTTMDIAERKGRWRAFAFYFFAALILAVLLVSFGPKGTDFLRGLWFGVTAGAAVNLMPVKRWLRPNNAVAQLLDDEGVREHRRMSCTAGFWAAIIAGLAVSLTAEAAQGVTPFDAARVIVTAAISAALVSFATLELRAGRG